MPFSFMCAGRIRYYADQDAGQQQRDDVPPYQTSVPQVVVHSGIALDSETDRAAFAQALRDAAGLTNGNTIEVSTDGQITFCGASTTDVDADCAFDGHILSNEVACEALRSVVRRACPDADISDSNDPETLAASVSAISDGIIAAIRQGALNLAPTVQAGDSFPQFVIQQPAEPTSRDDSLSQAITYGDERFVS